MRRGVFWHQARKLPSTCDKAGCWTSLAAGGDILGPALAAPLWRRAPGDNSRCRVYVLSCGVTAFRANGGALIPRCGGWAAMEVLGGSYRLWRAAVRLSNTLWTAIRPLVGRTISIGEIASGGAKVGLWLRTRGLVVGTVDEWILLGCRHSKSAAEVICGALTRREEGS